MKVNRRLFLLFAAGTSLSACTRPNTTGVPILTNMNSAVTEYDSITALAKDSSLVLIGRATGIRSIKRPVEYGSEGTFEAATIAVERVLSGSFDEAEISVYDALGTDQRTGKPALLSGQSFLLFLVPLVYGPNQPDPSEAYVPVGGPVGVWVGDEHTFKRISPDAKALPSTLESGDIPACGRTSADVISQGE